MMKTTSSTSTAVRQGCVDVCNRLLIGELSAVETYRRTITRLKGDADLEAFRRIQGEHAYAAELLRNDVLDMGEASCEPNAPGALANAMQSVPDSLDDSPALSSLRQVEKRALDDFVDALADEHVLPRCKDMIRSELLPRARRHIAAIQQTVEHRQGELPMTPATALVSRLSRAVLPVFMVFAGVALNAEPRSSAFQSQPHTSVDRHHGADALATRLLGSRVRTDQGEKVGRVEDVLIDWPSGRISGVVITSGDFIGTGDELSVVNPSCLRRVSDLEWSLDLSREKMADLPRFTRDRARSGGLYRAVDFHEHASGGVRFHSLVSEPDAPVCNRRNQDPASRIDHMGRGEDRSDVDTTARICSALVADGRLSGDLKNVKIVTRDGEVTLRGSVSSDEEKRIIADLASRHAAGRVVNQLDIMGR